MDLYGLIGFPLGHSFSARFFTEKFSKEGLDAQYRNFEIENAQEVLRIVKKHENLRGLNVTIPHKQAVIPLLDAMSDDAMEIGAVNVIRIIKESGKTFLEGHNTDVIGFTESIRPLLLPHHRKALVLGTGGASKAVTFGLHKLGIDTLYVSRSASAGRITYADITPEVMQEYTVIANCSPVGMHPHTDEAPAIPYNLLNEKHLLYDLVYNPLETQFLRRGKAQGSTTKNGLDMLHLQALAAWDIWNRKCTK